MSRHGVDGNHREIVAALRACGCSVLDLGGVGHGCPDILVGLRGANYLFEIKLAKGALNEAQKTWHAAWRGQKAVVRSVAEALRAVGLG